MRDLLSLSDSLAELKLRKVCIFWEKKSLAAFTFAGDTCKGLNVATLSKADIKWAQNHLRIISGLYGLLRPLDEIGPYRLDMGSKLKTDYGKNIYDYWN